MFYFGLIDLAITLIHSHQTVIAIRVRNLYPYSVFMFVLPHVVHVYTCKWRDLETYQPPRKKILRQRLPGSEGGVYLCATEWLYITAVSGSIRSCLARLEWFWQLLSWDVSGAITTPIPPHLLIANPTLPPLTSHSPFSPLYSIPSTPNKKQILPNYQYKL